MLDRDCGAGLADLYSFGGGNGRIKPGSRTLPTCLKRAKRTEWLESGGQEGEKYGMGF